MEVAAFVFFALQSVRTTHFREDGQGNVCQGNGKERLQIIPLTNIPLTIPVFFAATRSVNVTLYLQNGDGVGGKYVRELGLDYRHGLGDGYDVDGVVN
jgi:hypothetical protein